MEMPCRRCGETADHLEYTGAAPAFAEGLRYLICKKCNAIFNAHNATTPYVTHELEDICESILAARPTLKYGCYIFGPAKPGSGGEFRYEYEKRQQLKESLPEIPVISRLIAWARFPEEDMPRGGRSATGSDGSQEIRLMERVRREGVCPILFFLVHSPGTIPELKVAAANERSSLVLVRDRFRNSYVGGDGVVDLRMSGAEVYFYNEEAGCALRAFAEDFLIEKVADIHSKFDTIKRAREELRRYGIRGRRGA
jgi:hypothetical protein